MSSTELRLFMRFVTACVTDKIEVNLSGFARRPTSHTCDSVLDLPTCYSMMIFIMSFSAYCQRPMKTVFGEWMLCDIYT